MITNERQYKITKSQAEKFASAIHSFDQNQAIREGLHPLLAKAHYDQLISEYEILTEQLNEYDALVSGALKTFDAHSLEELPLMLIKARIAKNWTQKELADALGLKQQQVQRYESELYQSTNLKTLLRIADALDLRITESASLPLSIDHQPNDIAQKYPFQEMYKRGWFEDFSGTLLEAKRNADKLIEHFYISAKVTKNALAMHKKKIRAGGTLDETALNVWHVRVLHLAQKQKLHHRFDAKNMTSDWFRELAKLSQYQDGPLLAKDWLLKNGIHFIVERHLPQTHLDGAALKSTDGAPLVALTLRHDRLDNFWFVLFHELAHIALHFNSKDSVDFFDDSDIQSNDIEGEADRCALNNLVPEDKWETCLSRFGLSAELVYEEAKQIQIHPALIAGRIRFERKNYSLLNDVVGHGEVRRLFGC